MTTPTLTINELDLERLEDLLERPEYRSLATAKALASELERATLVAPKDMPADVVTMNSQIRFRDLNDDSVHVRTLVYPQRADSAADTLSVLAPLGAALLGLSVGQQINWQLPGGGSTNLEVEAVLYQPEAAGEFHR